MRQPNHNDPRCDAWGGVRRKLCRGSVSQVLHPVNGRTYWLCELCGVYNVHAFYAGGDAEYYATLRRARYAERRYRGAS